MMIVWINGAFGSGKTQTAFELHRRLPESFVYDPENIGYFIGKNTPQSARIGDFQDYETWREFNVSHLKYLARAYQGILVVPMTIVNPEYFDEIVGALQRDGVNVEHFALMASKQTLLSRLRSRGDRSTSWGAKQIDRCLEGLSSNVFEKHIDTERMTIEQVAQEIALLSKINLAPDKHSKMGKFINRKMVQLKHVRIF